MATSKTEIERAYEYATGEESTDLYAKLNALTLYEARGESVTRPRIGPDVPERARRMAHDQIAIALHHLVEAEADESTDEVLLRAAQTLERCFFDKPEDNPDRFAELHHAALAYYLSGQYARAFVILQGLHSQEDSADVSLMRWMFLRRLLDIRATTFEALIKPDFDDSQLATAVNWGRMDEAAAIEAAFRGTLHRIYSLFHEFARTGVEACIGQALQLAKLGQLSSIDRTWSPRHQMTLEQKMQAWWWTFHCTLALLREYRRNALWTHLRPMMDDGGMVRHYIEAAFQRPQPILELWRSQAHAVEHIRDGLSYCVKMPTSAGKTRIAELAILQFAVQTQGEDGKCLYVAPFRALSAEVEQSLRKGLDPVGVRVAQLYGSYDLNPAETMLVSDAKVLIATPEKLDAFLRYNPDIARQIGLIIVDEGHIIDADDRGLRYEMFIHRLVRRYERNGVRMLFMSAVMPNADQFAQWITGRDAESGIITSNWRASQQRIGILSWDGRSGRVDFVYQDKKPIAQDFFVTNYFQSPSSDDLSAAGCSITQFPRAGIHLHPDMVALAALQTVSEGSTLVFAPTRKNVEQVAKSILKLAAQLKRINRHQNRRGSILRVHINAKTRGEREVSQRKLQACIQFAEETAGKRSLVVRALKCGFVVHHAGIPKTLRLWLEDLLRDGILQLVISTTTLAQGVNLPVRTVILYGLQYSRRQRSRRVSVRDFWNICGRAGRAMRETEGHIYLIANPSLSSKQAINQSRGILRQYVNEEGRDQVISAVRSLLEQVAQNWCYRYGVQTVDIAQLCQQLTENDDTWLQQPARDKLNIFDTQLLAFIQEQGLEIPDEDNVAELFKDSMLRIQLNHNSAVHISEVEAISLIVQRIQRILATADTPARRRRFYSMGISLEDCLFIESNQEELKNYLARAIDYMQWSPDQRADYIVMFCEQYLLTLKDVRSNSNRRRGDEIPDFWPVVLRAWLIGDSPDQIATQLRQSPDIPAKYRQAMAVSALIDDLCDYRLPWGLNAVSAFINDNSTALDIDGFFDSEPTFTSPQVISYFASMLRLGVHCPVATVLFASGLNDRSASLALSSHYTGEVESKSMLSWIRSLTPDIVNEWSIDASLLPDVSIFLEQLQTQGLTTRHPVEELVQLVVQVEDNEVIQKLTVGMSLLYSLEEEKLKLYSPAINLLTTIEIPGTQLVSAHSLHNGSAVIILEQVTTFLGLAELTLHIM